MAAIDILRMRWEEARCQPFRPYLHIDDDGLSLGAGTVLARMIIDRNGAPALALDGEEERILALLSLAYRKRISIKALTYIKRASMQWTRGEKAIAHFELAYADLPRFETREETRLLFYAESLVKLGISPRALMRCCGLDTCQLDLLKYRADQPRVPAGNGRASGEWTSGDGGQQYAQMKPRNPRFPYQTIPVGGSEGGGSAFSSEGAVSVTSSSRALARALEDAGETRAADTAAHHIVAGSAPDALAARVVLQNYGIGINDAANGVFLPTEQHVRLHTNSYYDAVNNALVNAKSKDEVIHILGTIKSRLKSGTGP